MRVWVDRYYDDKCRAGLNGLVVQFTKFIKTYQPVIVHGIEIKNGKPIYFDYDTFLHYLGCCSMEKTLEYLTEGYRK